MRFVRLVWRRNFELMAFILGAVLRMSMRWNYAPELGYDATWHWNVALWYTGTWRVSPTEASFEAFHPPVYYMCAAWLARHGVSYANVAWLSIGCGVLRLALIWVGLELFVRRSRLARVVALGLAAIIPTSVHVDGMVYPEAMSCLWNAIVILLVPLALRRNVSRRWPFALCIGLILGLAMLTKVSSLVTIAAIGATVALEFALSNHRLPQRLLNVLPWVATLLICAATCGWYYTRNVHEYGRPFVTSFDLDTQHWLVAEAEKQQFLDRRTLGYIFGWHTGYYSIPIAGPHIGNPPRFFPAALASTFADIWGYHFQGYSPPTGGSAPRTIRSLMDVLPSARLSVVAGTPIFIATVIAWFLALRRALVSRNMERLFLLSVPLVMVGAALQFAIASPVDGYGVVKGAYMTFAAPPLYALFGLAVAWTCHKLPRWPLAVILIGALLLVAHYTLVCRFGLPVSHADWLKTQF